MELTKAWLLYLCKVVSTLLSDLLAFGHPLCLDFNLLLGDFGQQAPNVFDCAPLLVKVNTYIGGHTTSIYMFTYKLYACATVLTLCTL